MELFFVWKKKKKYVEAFLRGKIESLKATHLPALPFLSNGYLSDFLPPFMPFHTVYKYWQNLPALVEVSLHLNSFFWVQNFYSLFQFFFLGAKLLCSVYINTRNFFFFRLFVFVFIRRASLACHWCVCEIAWMSFQ